MVRGHRPQRRLSQSGFPPASQMFVFWLDDVRPAGFRNMAKLYVAAPVARGPRITPLPVSKLTLKASYREKGRIRTIADYMADNHTAGLLVLHRGRIVLERYGLGLGKDKVWVSNSAAKSFTSTLVGAAIKDGKIGSVDDPVTKYVPELRGSAWDDVTIRHALTMSTGIEYKEIYGQGGDGGRITGLAVPDGRPVPEGIDLLTFLAKSKRLAPAGTTFNYASSVSRLLGVIVANATGKPLNAYLSEKVWVPAGMEHDASWIVDGAGRIMSSGFLNATLHDYARFGRFFMLGGKDENGRSVLPDGWVAEATYPTQVADADGTGYGYQWWVTELVELMAGWNGLFTDADGDGRYDDPGLVAFEAWLPIAQQALVGSVIGDWWHRIDDYKHIKYRTSLLLRVIEGKDAATPAKFDFLQGRDRDAVLRSTLTTTLAKLRGLRSRAPARASPARLLPLFRPLEEGVKPAHRAS